MESSSPFLRLAPEVRNAIYAQVYPSSASDKKVDILNADPPSKALLLACRMVYHEACQMYKESYQAFWTSSDFVLTAGDLNQPKSGVRDSLLSLSKTDMEHINNLRIERRDSSDKLRWTYTMVHNFGGWEWAQRGDIDQGGQTVFRQYQRFRPWVHRETTDPLGAARDWYGNEASLKEACERYSRRRMVCVMNQVLHLLDLQLVDHSRVEYTTD